VLDGKGARVGETGSEGVEKAVDEGGLAPEAGQEREVDIDGQPWFAPALQGDAAYEAEAPALRLAEGLQRLCGLEEFSNGAPPS
jgi:hypothetical protein